MQRRNFLKAAACGVAFTPMFYAPGLTPRFVLPVAKKWDGSTIDQLNKETAVPEFSYGGWVVGWTGWKQPADRIELWAQWWAVRKNNRRDRSHHIVQQCTHCGLLPWVTELRRIQIDGLEMLLDQAYEKSPQQERILLRLRQLLIGKEPTLTKLQSEQYRETLRGMTLTQKLSANSSTQEEAKSGVGLSVRRAVAKIRAAGQQLPNDFPTGSSFGGGSVLG
jgi:hypothetical protein